MTATATETLLILADWRAEPSAVASACLAHDARRPAKFVLLVPAWLHGIDWVGDPYASRPCAGRALVAIAQAAGLAGLHFEGAYVGDPDPIAAITDVVLAWPIDRLLVLAPGGHLRAKPAALAHRAERILGLPAEAATVETRTATRHAFGHGILSGHCVPEARAA